MEYDLDRLHYACSQTHLPRAAGKSVALCFQALGYLQLGTQNHDSEFTHIAIGCLDQNHMRHFTKMCEQIFKDHAMIVVGKKKQGYSHVWTVKDFGGEGNSLTEQTVTFFPAYRKEDWEMAKLPYLYLEDERGTELTFPDHPIIPDRTLIAQRWDRFN